MVKNPRINVTFDTEAADMLSDLSFKQHKLVAGLVRGLTLEAVEMREDFYLSTFAEKLDKENVKTYSHEEAWGR